MIRFLLLLSICATPLLTGCGPSPCRQYAATLAANTGRLNDQIESLTKTRHQIEAARARLTDQIDLSTLKTENYNQRRLAEWTALKDDSAYKKRRELFESIRSYTDAAAARDAEIDALAAKVVEAREQSKGQRSEQLAEAAKQLAALSQERSLLNGFKFLASYVSSVEESLKKAKKDAEAAKDAATDKVNSAQSATETAANPENAR